jgi:cytochrome P450
VSIKTEDELAGCPVQHTDYRVDRPAMTHFDLLDADREAERFYFNDTTPRGFWVLTRHEDVLEAAQRHDLFSNQQVSAFDPNLPPGYFLPNSLDQPEHSKYRRVLNPYFSPAAVKRMLPVAQERATAITRELKERGGCEFTTDFAARYPTEVFMELLGLPVEDGVRFLPWNDAIFNGFFDPSPAAAQARDDGHANVIAYFEQMVDDRTRSPRDPDTDLVTRLITCEVDGKRLNRQTILNLCFTLNLAGLDTTKSALAYITFYLANHPEVRSRLRREPELWPNAIEELTRLHGLIIQGGRIVMADNDFHGLPMKANDVVWLGFAQASRDPRTFEHAKDFDLDRPNVNRHLSFGAGIHRCIGMHLARAEMDIALRTWHEHIPEYRVAADSEIVERGGQLSLKSLPLEWTS